MSWAALNRELRELLPRFTLPADFDAALDLSKCTNARGGPADTLLKLQASGLAPSPAEAEALQLCLLVTES